VRGSKDKISRTYVRHTGRVHAMPSICHRAFRPSPSVVARRTDRRKRAFLRSRVRCVGRRSVACDAIDMILLLLWAGGLLHSSGRGLLTIANWSLGTTAVVLSISFYTVLHFLLLILVSLPSTILYTVTNRLRGRPLSHPKHRRRSGSASPCG
jgi:hypothetical protein